MTNQSPMSSVNNVTQQGNGWTIYNAEAVEDKVPESRELKVQLKELFPFTEGNLEVVDKEVSVGQGETQKTSNYVVATYMGLSSNRTFPPDVYRGEPIIVFNYKDSDKYYWFSFGRDDNMRKVERYRVHVADERKTVKELNDDNTYFFEMDTLHNKRVMIQTSNSDGERYRYLIKFDAKEETIRVCDDDNNEFVIESATPRVYLRNKQGGFVDINVDDVNIFAPRDLVLKSGRSVIEDTPVKTDRETTGDGVEVVNTKSHGFNASNSFVTNAPAIGFNGAVKAESIVVKKIQAEHYTTGKYPGGYDTPTTNTDNGSGEATDNTSHWAGEGEAGNRHCVAWEDFMQFAQLLCGSVSCNCGHTGCGDNTGAAMEYARSSFMRYNQGE